jgi:hypothetical protein
MRVQVDLGLEDDKLLLHALRIRAKEMVFPEVIFQVLIVEIVLRSSPPISAFANMTLLMAISTVHKELIVAIKSLLAECTLGMPFESSLVDSSRIVVAEFFVLLKVLLRKQLMLVGENLFMTRAEVAHPFLVRAPDMPVQVGPTQASDIAV